MGVRICFADVRIDEELLVVWRNGQDLRLSPRYVRMLIDLIRNRHQWRTAKDLKLAGWGRDVYVQEKTSVTKAISLIRKALGDDPRSSKYIRTVDDTYRWNFPEPDGPLPSSLTNSELGEEKQRIEAD